MTDYANEGDVRDVLGAVARRKGTVLGTIVTFVILAAGFTLRQDEEYEATTTVLVGSVNALSTQQLSGDPARVLSNERLFIESAQVRRTVAERIDVEPVELGEITAAAGEEGDVIDIMVAGPDAELVAVAANTYAEVYLELRRGRAEQEFVAAQDTVAVRIEEVAAALAAIVVDPTLPVDPAVQEQRNYLLERLQGLQQTADQLELQAATAFLERDRILAEAETPAAPARPNLSQNIIIAVVVGLMAGLALALGREAFDRTVRVGTGAPPLPMGEPLAVIPRDRAAARPGEAVSAAAAEAYRSLRLVLEAAAAERPLRVIQVVSPSPTPLTAATAFHLGEAYHRAGNRVLLLSADMRTPQLHRFCGIEDNPGIATVVHDSVSLNSVVRAVRDDPTFLAVASGTRGDRSVDVLSSKRMGEIFEQLREQAEVIIVECAAVLPYADAMDLAKVTDVSIVVTRAGSTKLSDLQRSFDKLASVGDEPIGTVIHR